jgi:hypothetical protein
MIAGGLTAQVWLLASFSFVGIVLAERGVRCSTQLPEDSYGPGCLRFWGCLIAVEHWYIQQTMIA